MSKSVIVIPCYNERDRFPAHHFAELAKSTDIQLLFVNDGSKDKTGELLAGFCRKVGAGATVLNLKSNQGKSEAVRQGIQQALASGAPLVGYVDADAALPAAEIIRLLKYHQHQPSHVRMVLGSRIRLLGARIERSPLRHYAGRIVATYISWTLRLPVYDTQCGLKTIRNFRNLSALLEKPFKTRWFFDVELMGRLQKSEKEKASNIFLEVPLAAWQDQPGSKVMGLELCRALWELFILFFVIRFGSGQAPRSNS